MNAKICCFFLLKSVAAIKIYLLDLLYLAITILPYWYKNLFQYCIPVFIEYGIDNENNEDSLSFIINLLNPSSSRNLKTICLFILSDRHVPLCNQNSYQGMLLYVNVSILLVGTNTCKTWNCKITYI
jgi:hypothetical protein